MDDAMPSDRRRRRRRRVVRRPSGAGLIPNGTSGHVRRRRPGHGGARARKRAGGPWRGRTTSAGRRIVRPTFVLLATGRHRGGRLGRGFGLAAALILLRHHDAQGHPLPRVAVAFRAADEVEEAAVVQPEPGVPAVEPHRRPVHHAELVRVPGHHQHRVVHVVLEICICMPQRRRMEDHIGSRIIVHVDTYIYIYTYMKRSELMNDECTYGGSRRRGSGS